MITFNPTGENGIFMDVVIEDGRRLDKFSYTTRVLVDIYRSTSTMPILLKNGAKEIIPTESLAEAREISDSIPDSIIIGERFGFKVPGFDYGNSPAQLMDKDFSGKVIIFTSTNGTKVLKKIVEGAKVYIGSFINVDATYSAVKDEGSVSIVTSNRPDGRADEDYLFAEYLMKRLKGENPSLTDYIQLVRKSSGSRWLKIMGFWGDISASLTPNLVDFPVIYTDGRIVRSQ